MDDAFTCYQQKEVPKSTAIVHSGHSRRFAVDSSGRHHGPDHGAPAARGQLLQPNRSARGRAGLPTVPAGEIEWFVVEQIKCIGQDPAVIAETVRPRPKSHRVEDLAVVIMFISLEIAAESRHLPRHLYATFEQLLLSHLEDALRSRPVSFEEYKEC